MALRKKKDNSNDAIASQASANGSHSNSGTTEASLSLIARQFLLKSVPPICIRQTKQRAFCHIVPLPRRFFSRNHPTPQRFSPFGTPGLAHVLTNGPTFQSKTYPVRYLSFLNPHIFQVLKTHTCTVQRCRLSTFSHIFPSPTQKAPVFAPPLAFITPPPTTNFLSLPQTFTSQAAFTSLPSDPKTLRHALHQADPEDWNAAHDNFIYGILKVNSWVPVPAEGINREMLVNARWQFKYKKNRLS